ncbi:MAG: prepilin peptidase [bacterium]
MSSVESFSAASVWQFYQSNLLPSLLFAFIMGAALGSFANVVIYRLPRGKSLLKPASHCPHCGVPIPPKYNIPLFSFLWLKGQTACCDKPISSRYLIIEYLSAVAVAALLLLEGWSLNFLFESLWMILLLIIAAIDVEHQRIPNILVLSGLILSIIWVIATPGVSWSAHAWGAVVGFGLGAIVMISGRLFAGGWSGFGDLKLLIVLGFAFGSGKITLAFIVAFAAAAIFGLIRFRVFSGRKIPLGPFLLLGIWTSICCADAVLAWYWTLLR